MNDSDIIIKQLQDMKIQLEHQQDDISILNHRMDQLLQEINDRDITKNVNLI